MGLSSGGWLDAGAVQERSFTLSSEDQFVSGQHRARTMLVVEFAAPPISRRRLRSSLAMIPKSRSTHPGTVTLVILLVLVHSVSSDKIPIGESCDTYQNKTRILPKIQLEIMEQIELSAITVYLYLQKILVFYLFCT